MVSIIDDVIIDFHVILFYSVINIEIAQSESPVMRRILKQPPFAILAILLC